MKKSQIKGYLFEVIIGKLLESVGYRWEVSSGNRKLKGRGAFHEIDAIGIGNSVTPFVSNIRLLAEAKYYDDGHIGLPIVRNMFGALTDINESYIPDNKPIIEKLLGKRETNCAVIFSNRPFSKDAIDYGYAHNIYLVSYSGNPHIASLIQDYEVILSALDYRKVPKNKEQLKAKFYNLLVTQNVSEINLFKERAVDHNLLGAVSSLRDKLGSTVSVLGFVQGSYPIQITSSDRNLPQEILRHGLENHGDLRVFYHFRRTGENLLFSFNLGSVTGEFTLPIFLFKQSLEEGSMIDTKRMYLGKISIPIVIGPRNVQIVDLLFDEHLPEQ